MPELELDALDKVTGGAGRSKVYLRYTITVGDTLLSLANKYGTTVSELAELNHITDSTRVRAGQKLLIPVMK